MGLNLYVPDDVAGPYLVDAGGREKEAKAQAIETLREHAPDVEEEAADG